MKMTFDANPTEVYGWHEEKANRKFIEDWLLRMAFDPEDAALYAQKLIDLEKKSFKARVNFLEDIGEGIDRLLLRDRKGRLEMYAIYVGGGDDDDQAEAVGAVEDGFLLGAVEDLKNRNAQKKIMRVKKLKPATAARLRARARDLSERLRGRGED